jgi:hypothetical protein
MSLPHQVMILEKFRIAGFILRRRESDHPEFSTTLIATYALSRFHENDMLRVCLQCNLHGGRVADGVAEWASFGKFPAEFLPLAVGKLRAQLNLH